MSNKTCNRDKGKEGEEEAIGYLQKLGYQIVETNYRLDYGEIDIICRDKKSKEGDTLVFVEVKRRLGESYPPEEAITKQKVHKIKQVAEYYASEHPDLPQLLRFDVVAIENTRLTHYVNVEL